MDCTRKWGRPSIPPERLLRALLLQVFHSVRSERLLMEQLNYNRRPRVRVPPLLPTFSTQAKIRRENTLLFEV